MQRLAFNRDLVFLTKAFKVQEIKHIPIVEYMTLDMAQLDVKELERHFNKRANVYLVTKLPLIKYPLHS